MDLNRPAHWAGFALVYLSMLVVALPATAAEQRYAALIVDVRDDTILFERHARAQRHPASLTKLMTLYLTFEALRSGELKMGQRLAVSAEAASRPPSNLKLKAGDRITVEQAIQALVVRSANDVAAVVAETLGGTEPRFATLMTRKARELGMTRTTFRNASGLPDSRQVSTAWDMYLLARALIRDFPEYYHYFSLDGFNYQGDFYRSHNRLRQNYAGADGMKTGYIRASGFNLVTSVRRDGRHLVGVVYGGRTAASRDAHMRTLLDAAWQSSPARPVIASAPEAPSAPEMPPINLIARGGSGNAQTAEGSVAELGEAEPAGGGAWSVQVGAFAQQAAAQRHALRAQQALPASLPSTEIDVVGTRRGNRLLYRACLRGLSQAQAAAACRALGANGIDCLPLAPG